MVLSDRDIKKALVARRIIITPFEDEKTQIGSCSIDLRLNHTFRIFEHSRVPYIDPRNSHLSTHIMKEIEVSDGEPFILQPGEFVLASTIEHLTLADDLLGRLEGRSSLGRIGIVVHSTASVFEPGWRGVIVMELGNLGRMPVALYPGMRVCSLTFEELSSPAEVPYYKKKSAKYVGQTSPVASRIGEES